MEDRSFTGEYAISATAALPGEFTACRVILAPDRLQILPEDAAEAPVSIPFHQLDRSLFGEYQLQLELAEGTVVSLRGFGKLSDAFYEGYREARNNWLASALLLTDRKAIGIYRGAASLGNNEPAEAEIRIYPASVALLLKTETGENLAFSEIHNWAFREEDYAFVFRMDSGSEAIVRDLGKGSEEFHRQLKGAWAKFNKRAEDSIAGLFPGLPLLQRRSLSRILRDGIPVRKRNMDEISPEIWLVMEKGLLASEFLVATYGWLKERSKKPDGVLIGYKDTLNLPSEEEAGRKDLVFWFLCQVQSGYGNALAFEIASDEGHATYFFQLDPRAEAEVLCRNLRRIQFRREPVFMTEIACRNAKRYELLFAIRKIPALQHLRKSFLGRALHTSFASWVSEVEEILSGPAA